MAGKINRTKWYEKPLRIVALQCESDGAPKRVLDAWSQMGFNVEQLLHISARGYNGYLREDQIERTRNYIAAAKARNLRVIFYLGVLGPGGTRDNEAWVLRDSSGKSLGEPCVNSPFRDWYADQARKVADLGTDGIFIDGPVFLAGSCYCKYCDTLYRQAYGTPLPTVADFSIKSWRDFVQFRYESVARFVKDTRNALKSVNPQAILYMNGQPLGPGAANGRNNRMLAACEDMIGAEGGFIFYDPPDRIPWWKPGVTARLLESQAAGKATVVFIAGDHKMWNRYLHTAAETRLLIAATVANGASPWYGIHSPIEDLRVPGGQAAGEMIRFLRDNEQYYARTESLAEVGLLWSQRTADYLGSEAEATDFAVKQEARGSRVNYMSCFGGFAEMLLRRHVPFDVLDEQALMEGKLPKYKSVILPSFACASEEELAALRDYVRAGGNLVASFETSVYQTDLNRRPDFGLSDVFGAALGAGVYDFRASSYMSHAADAPGFARTQSALLPAPSWGLEVQPTTATPLAYFHAPVHLQYQLLPARTTPAILSNRYGKGRCVYMAGSFGEHFKVYGIPDYPVILANTLADLSSPVVRVRNLPETVELTLRVQRKTDRLLVHLVNFTGTMRRPISEVVRVHDAVIEIPKSTLRAAGIHQLGGVSALRAGTSPELAESATHVTVKIPPFDEYEVLAFGGQTE